MQYIFVTKEEADAYVNGGQFPEAPDRCPNKACKKPVKLKKHGFYRRYLITKSFKGYIRVRRYKCPLCGRTVSMLPALCISGFVYSTEVIWSILRDTASGISKSRIVKMLTKDIATVTRRHITYYLSRLRKNRRLLQYGTNQMSPGFMILDKIPGDDDWTKEFLKEISDADSQEFNAEFHKETGKTFLSLQNSVA
jgi:hypothetical protein